MDEVRFTRTTLKNYFANNNYITGGLILVAILLLTVSVLLLTHLHSSALPPPTVPCSCNNPFELRKNGKTMHKQVKTTFEAVNTSTPFEQQLDMIVKPGTEFHIIGDLLSTWERFYIDLRESSIATGDPHIGNMIDDLPLAFNPRFVSSRSHRVSRDKIIIDSKLDGSWAGDSYIYPKPFPFKPGKNFDLQIVCEEEQFRFAVNGLEIGVFERRHSLDSIKYIFITGELNLSLVEIITFD